MLSVVLEAVQVLVALPAHLAAIWLLFLHADGARVGDRRRRVDDRESAVGVLLQLLILVTVLLVVLETVLVLVGLLAADDGTLEGLDLFSHKAAYASKAVEKLVLAHALGDLAVVGEGRGREAFVAVSLLAQQTLCRVIDGARATVGHICGADVVVALHELVVVDVVEVAKLAVVDVSLSGSARGGRIGRRDALSRTESGCVD